MHVKNLRVPLSNAINLKRNLKSKFNSNICQSCWIFFASYFKIYSKNKYFNIYRSSDSLLNFQIGVQRSSLTAEMLSRHMSNCSIPRMSNCLHDKITSRLQSRINQLSFEQTVNNPTRENQRVDETPYNDLHMNCVALTKSLGNLVYTSKDEHKVL